MPDSSQNEKDRHNLVHFLLYMTSLTVPKSLAVLCPRVAVIKTIKKTEREQKETPATGFEPGAPLSLSARGVLPLHQADYCCPVEHFKRNLTVGEQPFRYVKRRKKMRMTSARIRTWRSSGSCGQVAPWRRVTITPHWLCCQVEQANLKAVGEVYSVSGGKKR